MGVVYVGGGTATTGGSTATTLSVTYTPTTGNEVIVGISFNNPSTNIVCKDNNNNVLALSGLVASATTGFTYQFYGVAITGATAYTITWTTGVKASMLVGEYSGVAGIAQAGIINTNTSSLNPSLTIGPIDANSFSVVVMSSLSGVATWTATAGNLELNQLSGAGNGNTVSLMDNIGSPTITCTSHLNAANAWVAIGLELFPNPQIEPSDMTPGTCVMWRRT